MAHHAISPIFTSQFGRLEDGIICTASKLAGYLHVLWLFTESDTPTFVLPNTLFGVFGGLTAICFEATVQIDSWRVLSRIPIVLLFNWSNLLIFDLANQRTPESVIEDAINKPWRPLPAGKVTMEQTRRLTMLAIVLVLAINVSMGVQTETMKLFILTWLYNDLKGGDGLCRNAIIAAAFGVYNFGSLKLSAGTDAEISNKGMKWIGFISCVILTTMHVQDLKDQNGDAERGRRTLPLVLGSNLSRWSLAGFIVLWSVLCARFWQLKFGYSVFLVLFGGYLGTRIVVWRHFKADALSWRLWCVWTAALYASPLGGMGR